MHEGKLLAKYLKDKDLSVSRVAEILQKKDRQSIYRYFHTEHFTSKVLKDFKDKLGFELPEILSYNENINDKIYTFSEPATVYAPQVTAVDYLAQELISTKNRLGYLIEQLKKVREIEDVEERYERMSELLKSIEN